MDQTLDFAVTIREATSDPGIIALGSLIGRINSKVESHFVARLDTRGNVTGLKHLDGLDDVDDSKIEGCIIRELEAMFAEIFKLNELPDLFQELIENGKAEYFELVDL